MLHSTIFVLYLSYYLTNSFLLNKNSSPTCEHCKCALTVDRILCNCTKREHSGKQYVPNSQLPHILLHSPTRNILTVSPTSAV